MVYEIEIPEGTEIEVKGNLVRVKGPKGELEKAMDLKFIKIKKEGQKLQVEETQKRAKAMAGTVAAHIKNLIKGVNSGFAYKLKVCYSHFPITVTVEGDKVVIKNFLGERAPRFAKILDGVTVEVKGQEITVSSIDIEKAGQTAANIEQAARVKGRDIRVFQDGIYITEKPNKVKK
ncbi:50S ribosomal protein L6 [Candidatus Micrarchaeota archaeon]|nr:MAG: 50S ribosomal protein L6 [Candidatus Micrarchaeota archaeon]